VSVTRRDAAKPANEREIVAATYASPAQLIAVQQKNARFDLENTSEQTVDAVARGRANRAIVWYPAVVAYQAAHRSRRSASARPLLLMRNGSSRSRSRNVRPSCSSGSTPPSRR
jgi:hypothetical protein